MHALSRGCFILNFLTLALCCSCGYHMGTSSLTPCYQTFSIPYVDGDVDGDLTATLVHEVTASLPWRYCPEGGDLNLYVRIIDLNDENIGFRYDYKKHGKRKNSIIPVETRLRLLVELSLIDAATQCPIINPVRLSAFVDFDHDYNYTVWRRGVTQFSLGQLTEADAAFKAARRPLNKAVAEKIVDYINGL